MAIVKRIFIYGCGLTEYNILSVRRRFEHTQVFALNDKPECMYELIEQRFNLLGLVRELNRGDLFIINSMQDIFIDMNDGIIFMLYILRKGASIKFWKENYAFTPVSNLGLIRFLSKMAGASNEILDENPYKDLEDNIREWGTHYSLNINAGKLVENKPLYEEEKEKKEKAEEEKAEEDKLFELYKRSNFPIPYVPLGTVKPEIFEKFESFFKFNIPRNISELSNEDINFLKGFYPSFVIREGLIPATVIREGRIPYGSYILTHKVAPDQSKEVYPVEYKVHFVVRPEYHRKWDHSVIKKFQDRLFNDKLNEGPNHLISMGAISVTFVYNNGTERTGYGEFGFTYDEADYLEVTKIVSKDIHETKQLTNVGREFLLYWCGVESLLSDKVVKVIVESHKEFDETKLKESRTKDPIEGQESLFDNMNVKEMIDKAIEQANENSPVEYSNTKTVHLRINETMIQLALYNNVPIFTKAGRKYRRRKLIWPVIGHDVRKVDSKGVEYTYWQREHFKGPLAKYFHVEYPPTDIQKTVEIKNVTVAQIEESKK